MFLGDRVVVMQPHPGRIRRIVPVNLPHPRNRSDPEFIRIRDDVLADFLGPDRRGPSDVPPPALPAAPIGFSSERIRFAW
ncbi:Aliphatic sulfonates import ATP-binding protein SsuB [compost metagenome]